MELEQLQNHIEKLQEELNHKKDKIIKLKEILKTSMKNDKRKGQQIETLQIDLNERDKRIETLTKELDEYRSFSNKQTDRISELEQELAGLNKRLQSGVGSEAAQKRNERMKQMLERSNTLYAELETKYQKVCEELENEKAKNRRIPTLKRVIVVNEDEAILLNDDNSFRIEQPRKYYSDDVKVNKFNSIMENNKGGNVSASSETQILKLYLKRVILEFLIANSQTQINLIPVILQLLECGKEQIQAAQRTFAENRQIISKASSAIRL